MALGVNCLVLDEPTNHLDLEAIEQLEAALEGFDGTLLLVTHDRAFLEAVHVTRTLDLGAPTGGRERLSRARRSRRSHSQPAAMSRRASAQQGGERCRARV